MITLRPYQVAARDAVYGHLRSRDDNPCVVIPTGGGKTPLIAAIVKDAVTLWGGRVLILAHVKELLEQAADKLQIMCPEVDFGIYSAGLRRRDTDHNVIVAGIQSVHAKACELGAFDLVIVDEAHLIPPKDEGRYRQFIKDALVVNPELRVVGLTATPYRLKSGTICSAGGILNHVCYEVDIGELVTAGFLSPLVSATGRQTVDTQNLRVRGGEYVAGEAAELMDHDELVEAAVAEVVELAANRQSVLIFAAGIDHARHVARVFDVNHEIECGFVCGQTPRAERDELLERFKQRSLKYLANVDVLTTGFDAPGIDCVVLLRPTLSPGLYYQMCGRGFRLHPDKHDCLVLDFAGNIERHGPVDRIAPRQPGAARDAEAPTKECPECDARVATGFAMCPECGFLFPPPQSSEHDAKPTDAAVLSGEATEPTEEVTEHEVLDVSYSVHAKRGAGDDVPKTMRVDYRLRLDHWQSEWICIEHTGYAYERASVWWQRRCGDPVPSTAQEAVDIANAGGLSVTEQIRVKRIDGEKFAQVVSHELGLVPEADTIDARRVYVPIEVPF